MKHKLKQAAAEAKRPKSALEAMGLAAVSLASRAFTQADKRPKAWPELKAGTVKAKLAKGYGSKPLRSSGVLAQSPRIILVAATTVTVGSDRVVNGHGLASIHQLGTKDGRIPARPFFPFDQRGRPTALAEKNMLSAAKRALKAKLPKGEG